MNRETIRIQYLIFGGFFFVLGCGLSLYERWLLPVGSPAYVHLGAIHGTIIVFFGIIPAAFMGLGQYVIPPLENGRMRFPPLDWIALFFLYTSASLTLLAAFLSGTLIMVFAMIFCLLAIMICSANFIATALTPAPQSTTPTRLCCVKWALLVLSVILFINALLLEVAAGLQIKTQILESDPALISSTQDKVILPLFWKHFFWFIGHPEVIILFLLFVAFFLDGLRWVSRRIAG